MAIRRVTILAAFVVASIATAALGAAKGELTQLPGRQGCLTAGQEAFKPPLRCARIRGLMSGNFEVQFANGGRTVYVTAESGIAVFDRDTGRARCVNSTARWAA